jgi:ribosomal protein S18 acetylase RimI-like enzyme
MPTPTPSHSICQALEVTDELYAACQRLVPQLTSLNPPPSREELAAMLASDCSILYVARLSEPGSPHNGGEIVGMATLILYRVPTGLRGYIEDVVVDEKARGLGLGSALTQACLDHARRMGAPHVGLTSNPARQAANRLYQKMGFEQRETNVYRYKL